MKLNFDGNLIFQLFINKLNQMKKSIFTLTLLACAPLQFQTPMARNLTKKLKKPRKTPGRENGCVEAKVDLKDAQNADYLSFKEESEMKFKKNEESINDLKLRF